jgi:hypothetical protein
MLRMALMHMFIKKVASLCTGFSIYKVGGELSARGTNRALQTQVGGFHSLFNVRVITRLKYETSSYL